MNRIATPKQRLVLEALAWCQKARTDGFRPFDDVRAQYIEYEGGDFFTGPLERCVRKGWVVWSADHKALKMTDAGHVEYDRRDCNAQGRRYADRVRKGEA